MVVVEEVVVVVAEVVVEMVLGVVLGVVRESGLLGEKGEVEEDGFDVEIDGNGSQFCVGIVLLVDYVNNGVSSILKINVFGVSTSVI